MIIPVVIVLAMSGCSGYFVATGPPAAPSEIIVAPPTVYHVWIPGYYTYQGGGYVWVKGYYTVPPRGKTYAPAHWIQTPRGYKHVKGHWRG